ELRGKQVPESATGSSACTGEPDRDLGGLQIALLTGRRRSSEQRRAGAVSGATANAAVALVGVQNAGAVVVSGTAALVRSEVALVASEIVTAAEISRTTA